MNDYEKLLERAIDQLPPEVFETKRSEVPPAYSVIQGNRTFIRTSGRLRMPSTGTPSTCSSSF